MWGSRGTVFVFLSGYCRILGIYIVRANKLYSFILLMWLKAQGQKADSEALFLWFCFEWVGFCRGGVHVCVCEIAVCGSKAGSSCSCRHFGRAGVNEVPVWEWSECKGRDPAEVDQSGCCFCPRKDPSESKHVGSSVTLWGFVGPPFWWHMNLHRNHSHSLFTCLWYLSTDKDYC